MHNNDIRVSVIMPCYNHEKYLKKAIESVLYQKTNFKFEIIIHDDASTDKSAQIIKSYEQKYPEIIKAIYQKENQFQKHVDILREYIYPVVRGEYIATCECDDFWCSSEKLQKQVNILDSKPNIIACSHNCNIVDDDDRVVGKSYNVYHYCKTHIFNLKRFENGLFPGQLAALLYRKEAISFISKVQEEAYYELRCQGDQKLDLHLLLNGDIYYMEDTMSAHRVVRDKGDSWTARISNKDMALYMFNASIDLRNYAKTYYNITLHNHYVTFHRGLHIIVKAIFSNEKQAKQDYNDMVKEVGSSCKAVVYIIYMGIKAFPFFIIEKIERNKYDIG